MKPKILIFIDWYLPAYKAGGPVKSVPNLVDNLKSNFDFDIITSDRDFGDESPFHEVELDNWLNFSSGVRIFYSSKVKAFSFYKKIISENNYKFIYLNSLYSIKFSILPLLISRLIGQKVILAPRGMLGKGALEIKKVKKLIFISTIKFLLLDKYVKWQATSFEEYLEIQSIFERSVISVVPNIPSSSVNFIKAKKKLKNELKLCFISRISEKKNLLFALERLIEFDNNLQGEKSINFDIYGPIEDNLYWEKCKLLIDSTSWRFTKVSYNGFLKPDEISSALSNYHFLFLPTRNENFGHIIYEAFCSRTPVIVSDQTPWKSLKEKNIGLDFDLNDSYELFKMLNFFLKMDQDNYHKMEESVNNFILEIDLIKQAVKKSQMLFAI